MYSLYGKSLMEIEKNLFPKGWNLFQAKEINENTYIIYQPKDKGKSQLLPLLTILLNNYSSQTISYVTYDYEEYLEISDNLQPSYEFVKSFVTPQGGISRMYKKDEFCLFLASDNLTIDTGEKIPNWTIILMKEGSSLNL